MDYENATTAKKTIKKKRGNFSHQFNQTNLFSNSNSFDSEAMNDNNNDNQNQLDSSKRQIKIFQPEKDVKQEDLDIDIFNDCNKDKEHQIKTISRQKTGTNKFARQKTTKGEISSYLFHDTEAVVEINYRKTKEIEFNHYRYLFNCFLQLIFSSSSILAAIVEYEHTVLPTPNNYKSYAHIHIDNYDTELQSMGFDPQFLSNCRKTSLISSYICFISSVFLWITIALDYILSYLTIHFKVTFDCADLLQHPLQIFHLIISYIIFIPCPNPLTYGIELKFKSVKYGIDYQVPLNSFFTTICLFRLWFLLKYYLVSSRTYNPSSFRILDMNWVDNGIAFPFKAHLACDPFKLDALLFVFCLFFCSYNLRIFERYLDSQGGSYFGNLINAIWCIFISMTTIGYGDLYPSTEFGCLFAICACFFGVFLVSLVVVSVTSYLNIKGSELNVYRVITRSSLMDRKNAKASKLIKNYLLSLQQYQKDKEQDLAKINKLKKKVVKGYAAFVRAKDDLDATFDDLTEYDQIKEHIKYLEDTIVNNDEKIDKIMELVGKVAEKNQKTKVKFK